MYINKFTKSIIIGGILLGLVNCTSSGKSKNHINDNATIRTTGVGDVARFYGEEISPKEEQELLEREVIYFDFDRSDISNGDRRVLLAHAKKLIENPKLRIHIAGHTDSQGSREYNIGLGDRRARSVAKILIAAGVSEDKISTVSYGKEKPAKLGNDESAWKFNRRAELQYQD